MKFCCGVTLYYPSKKECNLIKKYKDVFDYVYVYDNTDNEQIIKFNKSYFSDDRFIYMANNQNDGLSVAYNIMCKRAIYNGFDYICLFDQDSVISNIDISKIIGFICNEFDNKVAIYTSETIYEANQSSSNLLHTLRKRVNLKRNQYNRLRKQQNLCEIDWTISSGSFINLDVYQNTTGFDENYFIDRIDFDYCHTIRRLGYKVVKINNVFLHQTLGENGQHPPIRHYYIFRNRLYFYLNKEYFSPLCYIIPFILSLKHILKVFLFERKKIEKFRMIFLGLKDFFKGNMKKLEN